MGVSILTNNENNIICESVYRSDNEEERWFVFNNKLVNIINTQEMENGLYTSN